MVVVRCFLLCSKFPQKVVCRPGSAQTRCGSFQRSPRSPIAESWGREGKEEMGGQEGRKKQGEGGKGKEGNGREGRKRKK